MDKKSKSISGLKQGKIIQKAGRYYSKAERHFIIHEYLTTGYTKVEIWEKYTGKTEEHGQLLRWMRNLGYDNSNKIRRSKFGEKINLMTKKESNKAITTGIDDFEVLQLKQRIAELEKKLIDADMKSIAYSTMVDIAEKEFNIPIRKK